MSPDFGFNDSFVNNLIKNFFGMCEDGMSFTPTDFG